MVLQSSRPKAPSSACSRSTTRRRASRSRRTLICTSQPSRAAVVAGAGAAGCGRRTSWRVNEFRDHLGDKAAKAVARGPTLVVPHGKAPTQTRVCQRDPSPETTRRPSGNTAGSRPTTKLHFITKVPWTPQRFAAVRVIFQRRHAAAGRHVPHLERPRRTTQTRRRAVRRDGNARRPTTKTDHHKSTEDAATHRTRVPCSVATHLPVATSQVLSVWSHEADTTRRPSGRWQHPMTYDEARSSQKYSGRRNAPNPSAQRRHAFAGRDVPHLERLVDSDADMTRRPSVAMATSLSNFNRPTTKPDHHESTAGGRRNARSASALVVSSVATHSPVSTSHDPELVVVGRRHDAPPVRRHGNTIDLRRRHIITKVQRTPRNARSPSALQRRHAFAGRHVPHLERPVVRRQTRRAARPETWQRH